MDVSKPGGLWQLRVSRRNDFRYSSVPADSASGRTITVNSYVSYNGCAGSGATRACSTVGRSCAAAGTEHSRSEPTIAPCILASVESRKHMERATRPIDGDEQGL